MATTKTKAPKAPTRTLKFDLTTHCLLITVGKLSQWYKLRRLPSKSRAGLYALTKADDTNTYFAEPGSSCSCEGYRRYKKCKHADALAKLVVLGHLDCEPSDSREHHG